MIKFKIKHSTLPMTNYIESFKLKLRFTKQRARLNQLFTRALLGEISEKQQSYRKHISPITGNISTGDKEANQCPIERNPFGG